MPESASMLDLLATPRCPSQVIARNGARTVSWGEFLRRVGAWRALLKETGGRSFALYKEDSVEFAAVLFGAWLANKVVYLPGDNLPGTCASLRPLVDGYVGEFNARWSPITERLDTCATHVAAAKLDGEYQGLVLFTSGSTGAPQAIGKKLGQIAREVATLETEFGRRLDGTEIVSTVSHQHIYGLLFRVLWPLAAARVFHALSFPFFEELAAVLATRQSGLVTSPAHLKRLPAHPSWAARCHLRAVFSSGGPLNFEAAQDSARLLGLVPIEVYGSSETGGIAWRQQCDTDQEVWTPFPGVEWRIGKQTGALEVRSPNLPDDNWFSTADRVHEAGDGRFFLRGRIDRIVKIEGKRVSLSAIERLLMTSPLLCEARVAFWEERRQSIAAFIVLTPEGRRRLADLGKRGMNHLLAQALVAHIEPVAIPRLWRYLDALPINAQGKTTSADLIALLATSSRRKTWPRERIIEQSAERVVFELIAPADLTYFDGHFDRAPLLAGVVQIDWVIAYGRRSFDLPPVFAGIQALKFHRIIAPETAFTLELTFDRGKGALAFTITSSAGSHASGRVLFRAADV